MLWAGRIISWVLVVTGGFTWTVGQAGFDSTEKNLCELANKITQSPIENCHVVPMLVLLWQIGIFVALAFLVFDLVHWLWGKKQWQRHQRDRYSDKYLGVMQAILQIAERSAWGRWQDAQHLASGSKPRCEQKLHIAEHVLRSAAENGDVVVRARLKNSVEYSEIDRHFWRTAYIEVQPNEVSLFRAELKARHGVTASIPAYDDLLVERDQIEALWPRHDWKLTWITFRLKLAAKLKSASIHMSEVEKKEQTAPEPETTVAASAAEIVHILAPAPVSITPSPDAPEGWERLFAIGDEGKSVWLKFLPDKKSPKAETLVLIVYGYKILLGQECVRERVAYAAVHKTYDNAPNKPHHPLSGILAAVAAMNMQLQEQKEDFAEECVGSYLERVGLSQGGMYTLTKFGLSHAISLANDLIRRA
ncbi:MAG: hypothetical protein HXX15_00990 [Rhodopseudomonas sp.]|uniref:hypothetical protein n=1 Tax=Rhodopseudomonas sp. TaxID=1078 RepID=UPI0018416E6D|nr:hypothetical protein [Rhodopseudomonas sp.]NVN84635.1 hypothetical protein [Rhodopseudomonas sp.]